MLRESCMLVQHSVTTWSQSMMGKCTELWYIVKTACIVQDSAAWLRRSTSQIGVMCNVHALLQNVTAKMILWVTDPRCDSVYHHDPAYGCDWSSFPIGTTGTKYVIVWKAMTQCAYSGTGCSTLYYRKLACFGHKIEVSMKSFFEIQACEKRSRKINAYKWGQVDSYT